MLWALIRPVPDDLTDFGEIVPVIVFTSDIFVSLDKTSPCAGVDIAQSEAITTRAM
jgi:hypothetical protein